MPNLALTLLEWGLVGFALLICLLAVAILVVGRLISQGLSSIEEDTWR